MTTRCSVKEIEDLFEEHAKAFPNDPWRAQAWEDYIHLGDITQEQERQLRELAIPEEPVRRCVLCGISTKGSVGAAGIHWSFLCQPCKDKEDGMMKMRLHDEGKLLDRIGDQ